MLCKDAYEVAVLINSSAPPLIPGSSGDDCALALTARRVVAKKSRLIIELGTTTITVTPDKIIIAAHGMKRSIKNTASEITITPLPDGSVIGIDIK